MTTFDPYAAPGAQGGGVTSPDVPQGAVEALRGTRPWVLLFSILGFVASALIVVIALVVLVGGGAWFLGDAGGEGMAGGGAMVLVSVLYLLIGLLYFLPCLHLFRYAKRIRNVTEGGGAPALVEALDQQRRFWRLLGLYAGVMLVLYAIGIVLAIVIGAFGAFGGG